MPQVNLWAVVAAAAAAFIAGGAWYAPGLFGKAWQREAGLTDQQLAGRNLPRVFGLAFGLSLLAAFVFAMFLGPRPAFGFAVGAGFAAGFAWVAASFGINYLFERKSPRLLLINGGYHTLQFTLYGAVLGLVH